MKIAVISYSLTGNNEALAGSIAEEFAAEHIKVLEASPRTTCAIIKDVLFNSTPQVQPMPSELKEYDLLLILGPVWMGQVATPLRTYLKYLKTNAQRYAFVSISGGADGPNPKLSIELKKRTGKYPIALIDMHVADLLPPEPIPSRKETSAYRITGGDIKKMTLAIAKTLKEVI